MSFDDGFVLGYAAGSRKGGGSGGDDEKEWQPPADWIPVPEPGAYEMYFLVQIDNIPASVNFDLERPSDQNNGYGALTIDWGDGNGESYYGGENWDGDMATWGYYFWSVKSAHIYEATGQYLIKVTASENCKCFKGFSPRGDGSCLLDEISLTVISLTD